jgi:gas vesicle protein
LSWKHCDAVISKNIRSIRKNRKANADLIRKQKKRIEKDIRDLRETMNNLLDKLQEKLTRELMQIEVETRLNILYYVFNDIYIFTFFVVLDDASSTTRTVM